MNEKTPCVAVYGAGVSGLIAAYYFQKKGCMVNVIDPYGKYTVESLETAHGVVELAANSILANDSVINLLNDVGLSYEYYFDVGKKKYVFTRGKALRWPLSFKETIKSFKSLFDLARKKEHMKPLSYETIEEWGERVLNKKVTEKLICPALQGVYGSSSKDVSAKLSFGKLFERKTNKIKKSGSLSFPKGMSEFQEGLRSFLKENGVEFLKESVKKYDFKIVSTPSYSLPDFVLNENKDLLSKVKYKKVFTATVFVSESDRMDFSGFGCVFEKEPEGVLGLILNSDLFDGRSLEGFFSETWILNGDLVSNEEEALKVIKKMRSSYFKRNNHIVMTYSKHWEKAFPDYSVELESVLNELKPQVGVDFFANWTGALGIGSMIKEGDEFSENILNKWKRKKL